MSAAQSSPSRSPKVVKVDLRLPDIDDRRIPVWSLTRHAVTITMAVFGCVVVAAAVTLTFVSFEVTVSANGVLEPAVVIPARPLVSGTVASVLVRTGDRVDVGDPLLKLDTVASATSVRDVREQISGMNLEIDRMRLAGPIERDRAAAALAEAQARASRARTALRSTMAAFSVTGDIDSIVRAANSRIHIGLDGATADYVAAEAEVDASRASVASAGLFSLDLAQKRVEMERLRIRLSELQLNLARMTVVAPTAGVVLSDQPERLLHAAVSPGEPTIEVADLNRWQANLSVSEADVHRVHVADRADVEIPALSAMNANHLRGHVLSVGWQAGHPGSTAEPATQIGGYRLVVGFDSGEVASTVAGALRRGYLARAKVVTQSESALSILLGRTKEKIAGLRQ